MVELYTIWKSVSQLDFEGFEPGQKKNNQSARLPQRSWADLMLPKVARSLLSLCPWIYLLPDPRAMLVTEIGGARPPNETVLD